MSPLIQRAIVTGVAILLLYLLSFAQIDARFKKGVYLVTAVILVIWWIAWLLAAVGLSI